MELLILAGAIAIVVIAFSVSDYIDAKATALRRYASDTPPSDQTKEG